MGAMERISFSNSKQPYRKPRTKLVVGAFVLVIVSIILFAVAVSGKLRKGPPLSQVVVVNTEATSTERLVPRLLDGILVPPGQEAFMPHASMIDNQADARPWSGISKASLVIESPVEGGITRLLAFFDATTTVPEIGPVRSARPYFVDWAKGWGALYFHVGGSPDALSMIKSFGKDFGDVNEMFRGFTFWRSSRAAPHNVYTSSDRMNAIQTSLGFASSTAKVAWHFQDSATSTTRADGANARVQYGGSYSITWQYDPTQNAYVRKQNNKNQLEKDGTPIVAKNVVVIKTDATVLDSYGRLRIRTTGSGQAVGYRDGNRYVISWHRFANEPMRFEGEDGTEFLFARGNTWIQVTTDDRIFAGLAPASTTTSSTRGLSQ